MELGIKGNETRGDEVIKILEMLGGKNRYSLTGCVDNQFYIMDNVIYSLYIGPDEIKGYKIFSLEDFLEKFPYKVGDKVNIYVQNDDIEGWFDIEVAEITSMRWDPTRCRIFYKMKDINREFCVEDIKDKVDDKTTKNMEETKINQMSLANCDLDKVENEEYCGVLGYSVDDVIFTNDTGWIIITNKLWDCYSKEHVYEGIGIINGHEYKDIRHNNVTGKIQLGHLKHCKDVDDVRCVNSITGDIMINQITNKVSVIKFKPDVCDNQIELQLGDYEIEVRDGKTYAVKKKPIYPKNYKECCDVLGIDTMDNDAKGYKHFLLIQFQELIIARDAYWKIAGDYLELDKPWEPDWNWCEYKFCIGTIHDEIEKFHAGNQNCILAFPTEEMRDEFHNNFKNLIEQCKELL